MPRPIALTPHVASEVTRLYRENASYSQMRRELRVGRETLRRWMHVIGLPDRVIGLDLKRQKIIALCDGTRTAEDIADEVKCSVPYVQQIARSCSLKLIPSRTWDLPNDPVEFLARQTVSDEVLAQLYARENYGHHDLKFRTRAFVPMTYIASTPFSLTGNATAMCEAA